MTETLQNIEGIKCYAPELAITNDYFTKEYLQHLYKIEDENFWYRSRNRVIKKLFKKHLGIDTPKTIMEIGCGNGFILKGLMEYKNYTLYGADIYIQGLKNAKERLPNLEFIQLDATNMPFENKFDAIGAFDVLEHIEDDIVAIKNVYRALKPRGLFLISLPQYQWLWSNMDDIDNHKRRYNRKELNNKFTQNGFEVIYVSSFVFTLFPLMLVSRYFKRDKKFKERSFEEKLTEFQLNPFANFLLESFMRIDELLLSTGVSLPFGGSLIAVARKIN
jgi:SAM-dependent methyltransferase